MTTPLDPKLCACGCGVRLRRRRNTYLHGHNRRQPMVDRFWQYVDKTDGCWNWTATLNDAGYGVLHGADRRTVRAHRFSWAAAFGAIPPGVLVLHRCDNRRCVRPSHLFLGDHAANMADKVAKGRQLVGERHPAATLTDAAAREIRGASKDTATRKLLAQKFGVHVRTVCGVQSGRAYIAAGGSL